MNNEILPCPFCGAEPTAFWNGVGCVTAKCAMDGLHISIEAWNRRATQPAAIRLPQRKPTDHLPAEYKTMTPTRASIESYNRALDDVAALNAVRGAEHE